MAPKRAAKGDADAAPAPTPGNGLREGETVFGVVHIYASFNDTFCHATVRRRGWRGRSGIGGCGGDGRGVGGRPV